MPLLNLAAATGGLDVSEGFVHGRQLRGNNMLAAAKKDVAEKARGESLILHVPVWTETNMASGRQGAGGAGWPARGCGP